MDFWNAVGLILTFGGTALTFWQAYKAKSYRDEIQSDREKLILIDLTPIAKKSRDECKKLTTPVSEPMRGVDPQKIIEEIQTLTERFQEYKHRISTDVDCNRFVAKLRDHIATYRDTHNSEARYKVADAMYEELNEIIEFLAVAIDRSV